MADSVADPFAVLVAKIEEDPRFDVERHLREHPEHASAVRARLDKLRRAGLLGASERAGSILHVMEERFGIPAPPDDAGVAPGTASGELLPSRVVGGRYRVLAEIGRGGMGRVFRARDVDLGRDVALKVIDLGASGAPDSPRRRALVERFLAEARVTAQLEHPSIVPLHDVGVDRTGELFYTMKLVEGRTLESLIDEWHGPRAARASLPIPELLRIVLQICDALALAHERGVIHRDLKPSNVMVGRFGEVHVMDWGLAKVRGTSEPERTSAGKTLPGSPTATGDVLGTPSHMAPEQARGGAHAVDHRADVYGVGAILHHALMGVPPNVARVGPAPAGLPEELVAVCRRALRAEPRERYGSVAELGADLRAFLEQRVVSAHASGLAAHLRKWLARNRKRVAVLAVVLVLATIAAVAGTIGVRNRRAAEVAEKRDRDLNTLVGFNGVLLASLERQELGVPLVAALDETVGRLPGVAHPQGEPGDSERLDALLSENPLLLATILEQIGGSYRRLGQYAKAAPLQERALAIREREAGEDERGTIIALTDVASVYKDLGRHAEARAYLERALAAGKRALGEDDPATLVSMSNLGLLFVDTGALDEAERHLQRALDSMNAVLGETDVRTVATLSHMAGLRERQSRHEEAEVLTRRRLETERQARGEESREYLAAANCLGELLLRRGNFAEAETWLRPALAGRERVLGPGHRDTIISLSNLGSVLMSRGDLVAAEPILRDASERCTRFLEPDNLEALTLQSNFGQLLKQLKNFDEAEPILLASLEGRRRLLGDANRVTLASVGGMGSLYLAQRRLPEAERAFREFYDGMRACCGADDGETLRAANNLAAALLELDRLDEAEPLLLETEERLARVRLDGLSVVHAKVREKLVRLYETRHALDPAAGHDVRAALYRAHPPEGQRNPSASIPADK